MKRILIGLIVAAVLAAGGWFGFNLYVEHRVTTGIEAALEQIRSRGGKASHGRIGFDLPSRTLTIENINVEPAEPELANIKIAKLVAVGVRQPDEAHFAADGIEVSGVEVAFTYTVRAKVKANYKIPQITARDFAGPTRAASAQLSGSIMDVYRFMLAQFAAVSASSIVVPTVMVNIDAGPSTAGSGDFVYSGLSVGNVNRGKIEMTKTDRVAYSLDVSQPGKPEKMTAELSGLEANDFDATAITAALDPQGSGDDGFHRIYRRISVKSYTVMMAAGVRVLIGGFSFDDIAIQPSKFRPAEIMTLMPADRSVPTAAQSREMIAKVADIFEGFRIGKAEVGQQTVETPQGTGKLNAVRYDQDKIVLEGLDMPTPQGQFKMEHFALKSFSMPSLMRWAAGLVTPGRAPAPDQMLGVFGVLAGAEIKGVTAPFKNTRKLVTIDTLSLDWGQLVGAIPSKAHVVAKFVTPTDPSDPKQLPLLAAGIDKLAIDFDLGAAWTEQSNSFALAPAMLDIAGIAKAQLGITLGNVPREVFSTDPAQLMGQAARIEAGALAFSLRDNGGVEAASTQYARGKNVSRDAARQALADSVRVHREEIASANPEAGAAVDAIASFIETPGQTLVIKLTPRAKAPLIRMMQLLRTDPQSALAQFRIEASTGL
ncbi:hypothetical protein [Bradyrhizobium sp. Gha]|uniref:hypothetical protein n=1 Tax=Bradyrhizobium sp. Gha TaxID=1855318 RepID=UPI0008E2B54B|nr:hypothetical protein [Bradyrhizobium sp. Gha]SFJ47483.1 hypothetical protein SAMN05216525_12614 [Bradyrhizobium sp. Gha]